MRLCLRLRVARSALAGVFVVAALSGACAASHPGSESATSPGSFHITTRKLQPSLLPSSETTEQLAVLTAKLGCTTTALEPASNSAMTCTLADGTRIRLAVAANAATLSESESLYKADDLDVIFVGDRWVAGCACTPSDIAVLGGHRVS